MVPFRFALICTLSLLGASAASAREIEPTLRIAHPTAPRTVALTFDACSGATDPRILDALVSESVPATIFVTARWLKRNAAAMAVMEAHPDLFEIENHGADHVPAVTDRPSVFGVATAGSLDGVQHEVAGGAAAVETATGASPHWYRSATARYSTDAAALIGAMGYRIAGYSLNADMGASLPAATVRLRLDAAHDGDVVIAHINQPKRSAGAGIAAAIRDLKAKGTTFVRLDDAGELAADDGPTIVATARPAGR